MSNPPGDDFPTSVEVYDPTTGSWSATGSLNEGRSQHTTTLLPGGKVLVAAGYNRDTTALSSVELYEPASGSWSATGSSNAVRYEHTSTLLPNGDVLVAAGVGMGGDINSAELYHPGSGTWTNTGSLSIERQGHAATLLSNGKVLVTGGLSNSLLTSPVRTELYNPRAERGVSAEISVISGHFIQRRCCPREESWLPVDLVPLRQQNFTIHRQVLRVLPVLPSGGGGCTQRHCCQMARSW